MKINNLFYSTVLLSLFVIGCNNNNPFKNNKNVSQATGWKISTKDGGFKNKKSYKGQKTGPGLIFIEGGTYTKGNVQDNIMHDWNNTPTQQYVRSFFVGIGNSKNGVAVVIIRSLS